MQKTNIRTTTGRLLRNAPSSLDNTSRNSTFYETIGSNQGAGNKDIGSANARSSNNRSINGRLDSRALTTFTQNGKTFQLNPYAYEQFKKMEAAAKADGIDLVITTAYRDYEYQADLRRRYLAGEPGIYKAAEAGTSAHGLGYPVDISLQGMGTRSPTYKWLQQNAGKFGFKETVRGDPVHWEIPVADVPRQYRADVLMSQPKYPSSYPNSPNTTPPAAPTPSIPGNLEQPAKIADEFRKIKTSPDPIKKEQEFFDTLNTEYYTLLDNSYILDYYKDFQNVPEESKLSIDIPIDSVLSPKSDSLGMSTNIAPKYQDNTVYPFDYDGTTYIDTVQLNPNLVEEDPFGFRTRNPGMEYGGPFYIPPTVINKVPDTTYNLTEGMSEVTTSVQNQNQVNIYKPNEEADIENQDPTQSHGGNLTPDTPSLIEYFNNNPNVLQELQNNYPNSFDFNNFFTTVNDNPGYNPRDTDNKNLEKVSDFYYDINVEGLTQRVDILQRKYRDSRSTRTIKKALCICNDSCDSETETSTTDSIDRQFLSSTGAGGTSQLPIPVSLTQSAQAKIDQAASIVAIPNEKIAELSAQVDKLGISNIPGLQNVTGELLGSVSGLTSILQMPLNIPSVLPSVNLGSFPQIAGLILNTNYKNLDVGTALSLIQQVKAIACDFKLPIIGKIDFGNLTEISLDKFGEEFEKFIQGIAKKFERAFDDFAKKFENLLPNLFKDFQNFFKDFFKCDNKKDYSNKGDKKS